MYIFTTYGMYLNTEMVHVLCLFCSGDPETWGCWRDSDIAGSSPTRPFSLLPPTCLRYYPGSRPASFRTRVKDVELMLSNIVDWAFETVRTVPEGVQLLDCFRRYANREQIRRVFDMKTVQVGRGEGERRAKSLFDSEIVAFASRQ